MEKVQRLGHCQSRWSEDMQCSLLHYLIIKEQESCPFLRGKMFSSRFLLHFPSRQCDPFPQLSSMVPQALCGGTWSERSAQLKSLQTTDCWSDCFTQPVDNTSRKGCEITKHHHCRLNDNTFQSLLQFCNKCVHFLIFGHHINKDMYVWMCIYNI